MKTLFIGIILLAGTLAQADYVCTARLDNNLYVTMKTSYNTQNFIKKNSDVVYTVEYYGQSQNTNKAEYKIDSISPTRIGSTKHLKKTNDLSTWNDMPNELRLDTIDSYDLFTTLKILVGLPTAYVVHFSILNCEHSNSLSLAN